MREKRPMSSKQWLIAFISTVLLLAVLVAGLNFVADPFGAFGDRVFSWWDYNETMNPRVAKISYLEQHHDQYDSYIIGPSSTSSYPVQAFNEYMDASFYNLFTYGADMKDVELMSRYIVEHYEVKNLVLSLYINNAQTYDSESDRLTYNLHYKTDGSSPLAFYLKYLFINPRYSLEKLQKFRTDSYLQQAHDVFDAETGAYDKSRRDLEPISDLEDYLSRSDYAGFKNYPEGSGSIAHLEQCMESVQAVVQLCEQHNVNLIVVCPPMYHEYLDNYTAESIETFNTRLAALTDYWDFTLSSVSYEPRYFYDLTHFRNDVGQMIAAKMFSDEESYVPEDFGYFVTAENVDAVLKTYETTQPAQQTEARVPILLYHHVAEEGDGGDTIAVSDFELHMKALAEAGYNAVDFEDLKAFVEQGTALPENPIVITFDDGYESNLTLAAPILRQYGLKATVFTIGVSIGKDTYKDTGVAMTPHFSLEEALEYADVITVESHGYNFHEVSGRDMEPIRRGVLQKTEETEEEYIAFLRQDFAAMDEAFASVLGREVGVVAYPYGLHSDLAEIIAAESGVWASMTTEARTNTILKGLPQCLRLMGRYTVRGSYTAEQVLTMLQTEQKPE